MQILLPFDVETTSLYKKNLPMNSPGQPHLVSCSMLQAQSKTFFIQQSLSKVVVPDEWDWDDSPESEDRAFLVHGLSMDYCKQYGRHEKEVLDEIMDLWESSNDSLLIAHNLDFDRAVIGCAIARYYGNGHSLKKWMAAPGYCTMREAKPIVQARTKPNAKGVTRLKNPNLAETYEFFTGEGISDHHSSNRDAVACLQIYAGLTEGKDNGQQSI